MTGDFNPLIRRQSIDDIAAMGIAVVCALQRMDQVINWAVKKSMETPGMEEFAKQTTADLDGMRIQADVVLATYSKAAQDEA